MTGDVKLPSGVEASRDLPVASVLLTLGLSHLDRLFDYAVAEADSESAQPGVRVRVRFAGRLVDGFIIERLARSDHPGKLAPINRVVSAEQVLTPEVLALCRAVADRYAGNLGDVVRLAIPPRHARTEKEHTVPVEVAGEPLAPALDAWIRYAGGDSFAGIVAKGGPGRAAWQALPGEHWTQRVSELACMCVSGGHGALIIVPDQRDIDRMYATLHAHLGDQVVALSAGLGPTARYRRWLRILRGDATVVIGTRSAVFTPIATLGLIVVWDDGDDSMIEPRAPYPHPREVAVLRTAATGCALMIGGFARTAETQTLVESGWMRDLVATRATVRQHTPRVVAITDDDRSIARDPFAHSARIPSVAFDAARRAIAADRPVLISVPRRGYQPSIACAQCRTRVRCRRCRGLMQVDRAGGGASPPTSCTWCGHHESSFRCVECGNRTIRALIAGARRTAEELGRAFAPTPVVTSGGTSIVDVLPSGARVVVATPGAEPAAPQGYGAAIVLDTWAQLDRADLRAGEQTVRRWLAVASGVLPAAQAGTVVIVADAGIPAVQAIIRWDPVGFAATELAQRDELGLPPAVTMVSIDGPSRAVDAFVDLVNVPNEVDVLGPVDLPENARPPAGEIVDGDELSRVLLRVARGHGREVVAALRAAQVKRSAGRVQGSIRVQVDPPTVG